MKPLALLLPLFLIACSAPSPVDNAPDPDAGCLDDVCDADNQLSSRCVTGEAWDGSTPLFEEVSVEAGLVDHGVEGVRIAAVDFTANGYADLIVRRAGLYVDSDPGERRIWLLRNNGDGTFEDITESSGFVARRFPDGDLHRPVEVVAFADVNNNGHLDAVTLFSGRDPQEGNEILLNDGEGNFSLGPISQAIHVAGQDSNFSGASFVDFDRSGNVGLWLGVAGANQLLKGDGTGHFRYANRGVSTSGFNSRDILNSAGHHGLTWAVAACDLTANGTPDLLAANYGRAPNHLWYGEREFNEAKYTNHSIDSGYAFDHRQDWTDNESARCHCKIFPDAEDCEGVPEPAHLRCESQSDIIRWNHANDREPYRLGGNSGTTVCADLNNNGLLDLLTTEIVHWDVGSSSDPSEILYNSGEDPPRFDRPGNEVTGLLRPRDGFRFDDGDITAAVLDFDNDGRLDILIASTDYPGTRAHLFHQQEDGTFALVDVDLGIDLTSAHGIAVADFNGNGYQDVAIGHSRNRCSMGDHCQDEAHVRLFQNTGAVQNNWLQLRLEGAEGTNRSAIGAQVTIETEELTLASEVGGGHGHYGMQHDLVQHFGLGAHCEARVTIRWPDAQLTTETFDLQAGYRYHIVQGQEPVLDPRMN